MTLLNRAQRGYANLPFPRIATTNGMGSSNNVNGGSGHYTPETFSRFGLNITASATVNPVALKQYSENNLCLFYQNVTQMQVNGVTTGVPLVGTIWPGWWLTNSGMTLATTLNTTGGTGISMSVNGKPSSGFFGNQVCTANSAITTGSHSIIFTEVSGSTSTAYTNGASVIIQDTGAGFEVVTISSVSTTSSTVTFTATYANAHNSGCFIALLPFPALLSNQNDHSRDEVVLVTNQTGASTYTIQRGTSGTPVWGTPYGSATNPPSHIIGDRVAALIPVPGFITSFYVNVSGSCPPCPLTTGSPSQYLQRWGDYFATLVQTTIGTYTFTDSEGNTRTAYDGIFLDSANTFLNPAIPWADADENNAVDPIPGDGPSLGPLLYSSTGASLFGSALGHGVSSGIRYVLLAMANLTSNAPLAVLTNGSNYPLLSDGIYWESMQSDFTSHKTPGMVLYRHQQQEGSTFLGNPYPVTIYNYELGDANNMNGTQTVSGQSGAQSVWKNMRMYFAATTCLTDGFFCFDYGTAPHGQTWMTDEMDGGAGTCLTVAMTNSATTLTVASTAKFPASGFPYPIRVPLDRTTSAPVNLGEDEVMNVTSIASGTVLNVTRAITYNSVTQTKGVAQVGARVQTLAMQQAGQGWLGHPRTYVNFNAAALGSNLIANGSFNIAVAGTTGPGFGATFTSWTVKNTASFTDTTTNVNTLAGWAIASATEGPGRSPCLKYVTICPFFNAPYDLPVTQTITGSFPALSAVTFLISAKGDRGQSVELLIRDNTNGATIGNTEVPLTPNWTQYWITAYVGASPSTSMNVQVGCGNENGTVWLANAEFVTGDPNSGYRDFDNGTVFFNLTTSPVTLTLPAMVGFNAAGAPYTTLSRIAGSQSVSAGINDGTVVSGTTITIAATDGLFCVKS